MRGQMDDTSVFDEIAPIDLFTQSLTDGIALTSHPDGGGGFPHPRGHLTPMFAAMLSNSAICSSTSAFTVELMSPAQQAGEMQEEALCSKVQTIPSSNLG